MNGFSKYTNYAHCTGKIEEEIIFDHETHGEKYYYTRLTVNRLSGNVDKVPIIFDEYLLKKICTDKGTVLDVIGKFRSYDCVIHEKLSVILFIFVTEMKVVGEEEPKKSGNNVFLTGQICKVPYYREKKYLKDDKEHIAKVTDLLLAVGRGHGRFDYIPCIAWNNIAKKTKDLEVGREIKICGRIQSREYFKRVKPTSEFVHKGQMNEDAGYWKTAYEVAIFKMEC